MTLSLLAAVEPNQGWQIGGGCLQWQDMHATREHALQSLALAASQEARGMDCAELLPCLDLKKCVP
jgi:hypothetical protein